MDDETKSLIATAIVGLIVLAILIGSIYYLVQFVRSTETTGPRSCEYYAEYRLENLPARCIKYFQGEKGK